MEKRSISIDESVLGKLLSSNLQWYQMKSSKSDKPIISDEVKIRMFLRKLYEERAKLAKNIVVEMVGKLYN